MPRDRTIELDPMEWRDAMKKVPKAKPAAKKPAAKKPAAKKPAAKKPAAQGGRRKSR